jgi:hypothetical protein
MHLSRRSRRGLFWTAVLGASIALVILAGVAFMGGLAWYLTREFPNGEIVAPALLGQQ